MIQPNQPAETAPDQPAKAAGATRPEYKRSVIERHYEFQPLDDRPRHLIKPEQVKSFVKASKTLYKQLIQGNPTLVLAPLRGAAPIATAMQTFAGQEGKTLPIFFANIGTRFNFSDPDVSVGPTPDEKVDVLHRELADIVNQFGVSLESVALLDEVQSGSTFTTAANLLLTELNSTYPGQCHDVFFGGIRDTLHNKELMKGYGTTVAELQGDANSIPRRHVTVVDGDLPFVDRFGWLHRPVQAVTKERGNQTMDDLLRSMRIVNVDAERTIETFVLAVDIAPDIFRKALASIWDTQALKGYALKSARRENLQVPVEDATAEELAAANASEKAFFDNYQSDPKQLALATRIYNNLVHILFDNISERHELGNRTSPNNFIDPEEIVDYRYQQLHSLAEEVGR